MPFIRPVPKAKFCSKEVGERTEAIIIARLIECGYIVCIPLFPETDQEWQQWEAEHRALRLIE